MSTNAGDKQPTSPLSEVDKSDISPTPWHPNINGYHRSKADPWPSKDQHACFMVNPKHQLPGESVAEDAKGLVRQKTGSYGHPLFTNTFVPLGHKSREQVSVEVLWAEFSQKSSRCSCTSDGTRLTNLASPTALSKHTATPIAESADVQED